MAEKKTLVPLSNILNKENEKQVTYNKINILIRENIAVYCANNTEKKTRLIPFKLLFNNNNNFWTQKSKWEYFLTNDDINKLKEKMVLEPLILNNGLAEQNKPKIEKTFGDEYKIFTSMPVKEKIEHLNKNRHKLEKTAKENIKDKEKVAEVLADTIKDAALINRAVLEEAVRLADDEAKLFTQGLVDSTHEMVKASTILITEDIFNNELLNALIQKSNGTIVQHMTRVYLNGIAFLVYFNRLVSASSINQKIRIQFNNKYRKFYHALLPHLKAENVTLEKAFLGNLKFIPPLLFQNWAVGFLIHDIGKAASVEYHEGEDSYNRNIVIEHVKLGYKYGVTKTNYPMEANMITGYHHEYYGDPAGYGYFRAYLQNYKKQKPDAKQDYCVAYEKEPVLDFNALAYFPAKILEIVDVFDSLTDPNRVYRKPMKPEEALIMMRDEFIEKHLKIDPILFDIFASFIEEKLSKDRQNAALNDRDNTPSEEELKRQLERNAQILNELLEKR